MFSHSSFSCCLCSAPLRSHGQLPPSCVVCIYVHSGLHPSLLFFVALEQYCVAPTALAAPQPCRWLSIVVIRSSGGDHYCWIASSTAYSLLWASTLLSPFTFVAKALGDPIHYTTCFSCKISDYAIDYSLYHYDWGLSP